MLSLAVNWTLTFGFALRKHLDFSTRSLLVSLQNWMKRKLKSFTRFSSLSMSIISRMVTSGLPAKMLRWPILHMLQRFQLWLWVLFAFVEQHWKVLFAAKKNSLCNIYKQKMRLYKQENKHVAKMKTFQTYICDGFLNFLRKWEHRWKTIQGCKHGLTVASQHFQTTRNATRKAQKCSVDFFCRKLPKASNAVKLLCNDIYCQ